MEPRAKLFRNRWITLTAMFAMVAGLALSPSRAGADTFTYGPQSTDFFYGRFPTAGSFLDHIQFSVAAPATITLLDNFTNFSLISSLNATLFNSAAVAVYAGTPNTPVVGSSFQNLTPFSLAAGSYDLHIGGNVLAGGFYSGKLALNSTAMPIPEPETYAMILAGLGLMGFVARRRKQKDIA